MKAKRFLAEKENQAQTVVQNGRPSRQELPGAGSPAFTLLELLVVIAVLGILGALLFPALARAKERARRIKCLANVKQLDLWLITYAQDNHDHFPQWDLSGQAPPPAGIQPNITPSAMSQGLARDHYPQLALMEPSAFQIPGFVAPNFSPDMHYYCSAQYAAAGQGAFNGYNLIGYALALSPNPLLGTNVNRSIYPEAIAYGPYLFPAPDISRRVLVACLNINARPSTRQYLEWYGRQCYWWSNNLFYVAYSPSGYPGPLPPHPNASGQFPAGSNEGMLDGSAHWKKFNEMISRTTPGLSYDFSWWW